MCSYCARQCGSVLNEREEFRSCEGDLPASAIGTSSRLSRKIEKEVSWNYGATDRERKVIGMERLRLGREVLAREHALVSEIISCRAVKAIRARSRREESKDPRAAGVFNRKSVDFNSCVPDPVWGG